MRETAVFLQAGDRIVRNNWAMMLEERAETECFVKNQIAAGGSVLCAEYDSLFGSRSKKGLGFPTYYVTEYVPSPRPGLPNFVKMVKHPLY